MATERRSKIGRRSFLLSAGSLAATPLLAQGFAQAAASSKPRAAEAIGRRRLGSLEVSSIGLGEGMLEGATVIQDERGVRLARESDD